MVEIFRRIFVPHMFDPSFSQAYAEIYFGCEDILQIL